MSLGYASTNTLVDTSDDDESTDNDQIEIVSTGSDSESFSFILNDELYTRSNLPFRTEELSIPIYSPINPRLLPSRINRINLPPIFHSSPGYEFISPVPAFSADANVVHLLDIFFDDILHAHQYNGAAYIVEVHPAFPGPNDIRLADGRNYLIRRGDLVVFNKEEEGFVYEFTRIRLQTGDYCDIEVVAFNAIGAYFTEASAGWYPLILRISNSLVDPNFDTCDKKTSY